LAPVVAMDIAANEHHPYQRFLDTAFAIQIKLNDAPHAAFILQGDTRYRNMLGLPSNQTVRIEEKINAANTQDYLDESFNFLCLLNEYEANIDWRGAFQNIDPFILYRMLLVKQLANLADPNNLRVDSLVKDEIKRFVRSKLNYNPDVAFDDILNQALLIKSGRCETTIRDTLGNPRLLSELSYIADAVRVDMAYVSSSMSPEQLVALEAERFLMTADDKIIFGYNSIGKLIPELSQDFCAKINDTIDVTKAFLAAISTNILLQQTSTIRLYLQMISNEVNRVKHQIAVLKPLLVSSTIQPLDDVLNALEAFKQTLALPEAIIPEVTIAPPDPASTPAEQPLTEGTQLFPPQKTVKSFALYRFFHGLSQRHTTNSVAPGMHA